MSGEEGTAGVCPRCHQHFLPGPSLVLRFLKQLVTPALCSACAGLWGQGDEQGVVPALQVQSLYWVGEKESQAYGLPQASLGRQGVLPGSSGT